MTTGNPISGHTNANTAGPSGDGLADGNHVVSASLTNLYEGVLGNGILMSASTDGDDANRNTPTSLPGLVTNSGIVVTVRGGLAIMDGVIFEFGNGEGNTVAFTIGNAADHLKGSDTALNSSTRDEVFYTVYIAPEENGANKHVYYIQGTAIDTASATYADTPAGYLNDPNETSSVSAKTSIVLATIKCSYNSGGGNSKVEIDAISDKRVFVRPSPLYLTPTVGYNSGGTSSTVDSAADLDALHNGATGNLNDSDIHNAALWLSEVGASSSEVQALYFSAKSATATRFDRTLETRPTVSESSPSGTTTFTYENGRVFILTPSTAVQFNPSGDFPIGYTVYVSNRSASDAITFDSGSVAATATITISDYTELNAPDKVNLVATDGTNYDFVQGDQSSVAGTFEATTSNDATATNLMNVINTSSGPAGTRFTATVSTNTVTVTQATAGSAGNTTVTLTDSGTAGMTKTDFTGGLGITDALAALESAIYVYDGTHWHRAIVGTSTHPTGDITAVTAGVGLSGGGTSGAVTLALDLSELSTVTPANGDFFSTLDSDGSTEQKTAVSALATLFAGDGLTASSSVMAVGAGTLIDVQANQVDVDLSEASAAVMAEADEFIFLDNDDSSAAKRESLSDLLDTIAGTVATTGLDRSGGTLVVSDLHPVGVSGAANQLLTDDGDGTVTSEANLLFDGTGLKIKETADAAADTAAYGQIWVNTATPNELYFTTDAGDDIAITSGTSLAGGGGGASALDDLSDVSYSSGDLTITSLDTVTFANGGAAVVTVANTAANTAGKDLTISAGSEPGGASNNADGGDLILASGGGDGTGTSAMTFSTKVSGTDAVAERMRIHTDGNVGIGIATPAAELDIAGSGGSDGAAGSPTLRLSNTVDTTDWDINDVIGTIEYYAHDVSGNAPYVSSFIKNMADTSSTTMPFGGLAFGVSNENAAATEQMRLNYKGALGIGTTTIPHGGIGGAKLALEGAQSDRTNGPHIQCTTAADDYPLFQMLNWSHDNITLAFDSYYHGAWKSSDAGSNFAMVKNSDLFKIRYDSGIAAGSSLTWNDGITLDTSGNVGIGTSAPAVDLEILDITGSSATQGGSLRLSANDGATMADDHRLGVIEFAGAEDASDTMTVGARIEALCDATWSSSENGASLLFYTTDGNATQSEVMRITSDKFVGIGTDAPNQPLTIEGTMSMKEQANANADVAAYGQLWIKSDTPNGLMFTDDAGNDVAIAAGAKLMSGTGLYTDSSGGGFWTGPGVPTTVNDAINRIAAVIVGIHGQIG